MDKSYLLADAGSQHVKSTRREYSHRHCDDSVVLAPFEEMYFTISESTLDDSVFLLFLFLRVVR